ncbi:MAG: glycosyltransferase family 4 protein [Deltaproteobacteria bacterium]|nr:glycosyltransferase family 4 protein [Deltaproteobacteria bacterium]
MSAGDASSGPLRVTLLTRRWSVRAGNERVAVELARQLGARGHAVDVYVHRDDGSAVDLAPNARVHRLPGVGFDPTLAMLSYALVTERLVARLRRERATDVIVGFGHSLTHDVYRLGAGTHAEYLRILGEQPGAPRHPLLDRAALRLERIRLRPEHTRWLVAPSERVRAELIGHYAVDPARIEVIGNGIDRERFSPAGPPGERAAVRARWRIGEDETVLLFVGQDPERKGWPVALAVARALGARLVYVGRAPRPREVPAPAVWDGERRDVEACYRAADLLVLPSHYDPFGGVVLEALASGLPAVATARIGATERMRGSALDRLRIESPSDVTGFVEAARWALAPERRAALRAIARDVTAGADREAWAARMEAVLLRAVREAPRDSSGGRG